jgi:tetratricopeptide (TPR) repeat protein
MKKLILSIALVGVAAMAFAQKKVVSSADKNFKKGELEVALTEIEAALESPDTKDDPNTTLIKAKIQTKMFEKEEDFTQETVDLGKAALSSFDKVMNMVNNDKNSKFGKEVYKEDLPGMMPDNLRPFSKISLKNAAFNKAILTYEEENFPMSYEFFALAGDIDPLDTTAIFNAGFLALNELDKYEEAKVQFKKLLEMEDYNKLNAFYFLIQIASAEEQDPEQAYQYVVQARKDYPEDKTLSEFEVQLLLQMNKMDEALVSVKDALEDDPENAGLLLRHGYLLEQSGDLDGALAEYKKSVEVDPKFFEGNYYTGALFLDKASKILMEINELSDSEWEKRAEGMGKEADQLYRDAIPYFTKASDLKPDNTEILEILYNVHTRLKNTAEIDKYNKRLSELLGADWEEKEF